MISELRVYRRVSASDCQKKERTVGTQSDATIFGREHMAVLRGRCRSGTFALGHLLRLGACAMVVASCTTPTSYQAAAIEASQSGDQKTAVHLARKEVARFSSPDQCSNGSRLNCGTLALAYGSLAEYQILDGDKAGGESSFSSAKHAIGLMEPASRPSAIGMVYRDVSEGYWKVGDRARAVAIFKEGRAAGGDSWLSTASAAAADKQGPVDTMEPQPVDRPSF